MVEVKGDLFTWQPPDGPRKAGPILRVITTNGTVKANGEAVMGRGCAAEAKRRWPSLPKNLGIQLSNWGLKPYVLTTDGKDPTITQVMCFPVKYEWMQAASLTLIKQGMIELTTQLHEYGKLSRYYNGVILMPRPGCGNGRLTWDKVKPVLLEGIEEGYKKMAVDYGINLYGQGRDGSDWLYVISPADKTNAKSEA